MSFKINKPANRFNVPVERPDPLRRRVPLEDTVEFPDLADRFGGGRGTTVPPVRFPPQPPVNTPPGTTPPANTPPDATPPAAPPQPPLSVAVDLRPLMAFMPIANDGQVITAEYHNSLRAAILAIAERLGVGAVSPTNVLTLAPMFLKRGTDPEWVLNEGIATKPTVAAAAKANAAGWFAVQLPEGSRIEGIIVTGRRTGAMEQFNVSLARQRIADTAQNAVQVISIALKDAADPFEQTGVVDVSAATVGTGAGGAAAAVTATVLEADFRRVDNDNYKYLIRANLVNADAAAVAQINSIQVVCKEV